MRLLRALLVTATASGAIGLVRAATTPASLPLAAAAPAKSASTSSVDELFKQALFEEEGRRNYEAAVSGYEVVVRALDQQRRLAASAVFRLGECYRKLRRTNDAVAQFRRVLREFSDEDTLVTLSRQNLAALGAATEADSASANQASGTVRPGAAAVPALVEARAKAVAEYHQLSTQLHQVSSVLSGNLQKQAFAALSLHPDAPLQAMLEYLPKLQDQFNRLDADPKAKLSRYYHALTSSQATGRPDLLDIALDDPPRDRAWAQQQLEKQWEYIRDRMNFVLEIERGRLQILKGSIDQFDRAAAAGQLIDLSQDATSPTPTEESQEILRIQTLARNSPDLINALRDGGQAPLHKAAARGQLAVATYLLDHGAQVNLSASTPPGGSPLHMAANAGHKAMIELLLQRGARLDHTDQRGRTPLHLAAANGYLAIVDFLLSKGASVNLVTTLPGSQGTPLSDAVALDRLEVVRLLLSKGADPNLAGPNQKMPLARAISPEMVAELLAKGANPDPDSGETFLGLVRRGQLTQVRAVLEAVERRGRDRRSSNWDDTLTQALAAAIGTHTDAPTIFDLLLKHGADINRPPTQQGPTVLIAAIQAGMTWSTRALEAGANPNLALPDGTLPFELLQPGEIGLGSPAVKGKSRPPASDPEARWPRVRQLLEKGADPNRLGSHGSSLTHQLSTWAGPEEFALLRQHGADFERPGSRGETPLMVAVCNANAEGATWLLQAGVDINATDRDGNTALILASARQTAALGRLLIQAKADPSRTNRFGDTARTALLLSGPTMRPGVGPLYIPTLLPGPWAGPSHAALRNAFLTGAPGEGAELFQVLQSVEKTPEPMAPTPAPITRPRTAPPEPHVTVFGSLFCILPIPVEPRLTLTAALRHCGAATNTELHLARIRLHRAPPHPNERTPEPLVIDAETLLNTNGASTTDLELRRGDAIEIRRKKS